MIKLKHKKKLLRMGKNYSNKVLNFKIFYLL